MTIVYVGLGSNMGQSEQILKQAVDQIKLAQGVEFVAISPIYSTEPQGLKAQEWFKNQVLKIKCTNFWSAQSLLKFLQEIELKLGRTRSNDEKLRFGPRVIDLDLLFFGHEYHTDEACIVPHPRLQQRAFVLVPLRDVVGEDILPIEIQFYLDKLDYRVKGQVIYQV